MAAELQAYVHHRNTRIAMPQAASTHISAETPQKFAGVKAAVHQVAGQHDTFHSQAQSTPPSQSASQPRSARKDDAAYAHLNPEAFQKLQADLAKAEEKYGKLMREALTMPEPDRSNNMAKWKNCYNTKQSMTRKKYGIRLREKRTQDEIDAERRRLLGDNGPEKWLEMERSAKRPRTDGGPSSQTASPLPTSSSAPQPDQSLTPRKRVALADMGGLSGSVGSAEMTDPTTLLKSSEPRGLVHLQQSQGQSQVNESQALPLGSKQDEPMTIAEDSSSGSFTTNKEQMAEDDMSTSSDDDGSNGDIPAR